MLFYRAVAKVYDSSSNCVADGICGNPHSVHHCYDVGHDDSVRLVYFDEKRTSISNVIVIFHGFSGYLYNLYKGKLQVPKLIICLTVLLKK